jgi:DtxR family Mn-dependent transcriptional regulator
MKEAISTSKEDYLKAILEAESEGLPVIAALLAARMEVSPPAVTMALKRLKRDGLVEVGKGGGVSLSEAGRENAFHTLMRHHLVERMLSEIFGMEGREIHEDADRLEHAISPAFEAKLREKLGDGGACPHGNSILPEPPAQRRMRGERPLSEAEPGKRYEVVSMEERDTKLLLFLYDAGIRPGRQLTAVSQNYDQTVSIQYDKEITSLGKMAAEAVWLKPVSI